MVGRIQTRLWGVALDQHGYVTSRDATRLGINVVELGKLASRNQLERLAYGIYRFPQLPVTPLGSYMFATLWANGRGVLSHDTALDLHELCDINPTRIHLTVSTDHRYKPSRKGGELYVVHKEHLDPAEVTNHEGIPIVAPATAIGQAIRSGVQSHLVNQAIETARGRAAITTAERDGLAEALRSR